MEYYICYNGDTVENDDIRNKLPKIILNIILKNSTKKHSEITRNAQNINHESVINTFHSDLESNLIS